MRRDFHTQEKPTVMIIPMIDIMLFLLVFFMISTLYMVQLNTLPINLPAAASAPREMRPELVSVTVTAKGEVFYDMDTRPSSDIAARAAAKLAENPEVIFVIRGDKKASYEDVTDVLDVLKSAGVQHVSLATETKPRS